MTTKYRLTRPARPIDLPGQTRPTVTVWVESVDHDEDGELFIEGDPDLIERVRGALDYSYGSRGRSLNTAEPFSPRDLACALFGRWMTAFEAVELEPEAS